MVNSVIDAICIALDEAFGDGYKIYTERVKQGFKEPCFFVSCINPSNKRIVGERHLRSHLLCVQFFPDGEELKAQCHTVQEQLYDILEYIDVDGLIMGTGMRGEIVDDVLSFFVNYDFHVIKTKEKVPVMGEIIIIKQELKG